MNFPWSFRRVRCSHCVSVVLASLLISSAGSAGAQPETLAPGPEEIVAIPFDVIPEDTVLGSGSPILLDGNVTVSDDLQAQGMVAAQTTGYKFPDGTIQTTAAGGSGVTGNSGLYDNRIINFEPSQPFSEICFKQGQVLVDIHAVSESTAGGDCLPGDLGWVIERNQRSAALWVNARVVCLLEGMRLPEPFEWFYSCNNAPAFGLNNMVGDWEWSSNTARPIVSAGGTAGVAVAAAGRSGCGYASYDWLGHGNGGTGSEVFRCLR